MRNVSNKNYRENQDTYFILNNFFFLEVVPFVKKYGRTRQVTGSGIIRGMRFACWITKARMQPHLIIFNT
jgi:hypothetical protein